MKYAKALGLAVVVSIGAVALFATTSASATVICQSIPIEEGEELICPNEETYQGGPIYVRLKPGAKINFNGFGKLSEAESYLEQEFSEEEVAPTMFSCNEGLYIGFLEEPSSGEISSVSFNTNGGKCDSKSLGKASVGYTPLFLDYQFSFAFEQTVAPEGIFKIDELTKTGKMAFQLSLPGGLSCEYQTLTPAVGEMTNGAGAAATSMLLRGGLFAWAKGWLGCPAFLLTEARFTLMGSELSNLYLASK
jgi:hypothetical protein